MNYISPTYPNPYGYSFGYGQPQNQSKPTDLLQVNGLEGARNYPVSPNSRMVLFDSNQDIFYIKSTDAGGYPSISAFQFSPVSSQEQNTANYATKEDLNILLDQITSLRKEIQENGKLTISTKGESE